MRIGRLHLITPPAPDPALLAVLDTATAAGVPVVQVRAKHLSDRAFYDLTCRVQATCAARGASCIVNDRVHVAAATATAGVHVGADDLPVGAARRLLGPDRIVGATARDPRTARRLVDEGADYLGVGPCFASTTKTGLPAPLGLDGLRRVAEAVTVPVIAIAGITPERVAPVLDAGAHGVAVVGAVWNADDPRGALDAFLDAIGEPW